MRTGDRPTRCFLVQDGFACSYKITGAGTRQILNFHVPGDVPDLQSLHLDVLDFSIGTITPCTVGFIQHDALHELCRQYPQITSAFWRETLIDAAMFRDWIVNNGKRDACAAMAHLLCELLVRLRAVGLAQDFRCDLPVTQSEFADALGISTVHTNRVVQDLRAAGLIILQGRTLTVLDWVGLKRTGDFDPTYLHLKNAGGAVG